MIAYLVRRLLYAIPILVGVNVITFGLFFMVNTPDDMARMQLDYGFRVFYDDKGTLKEINPVETKARDLQDHHDKPPVEDSAPPPQDHTGSVGY